MNPKPVEQAVHASSPCDMATQEPTYFDPQVREREKQASRDADERALANGMSIAELEAKNAFLTPDRAIIHWDPDREF